MSSDSIDGIIKYVNEGRWYKYIYVDIYVFMFICIYCICIYLFTLLAHVAPSDCEVRLFVSKRTTEAPDKPITKSQTLADTQQSARAAFMRRLLDVIAGRLCVTSGHTEGELSKLFAWHWLCCFREERRRLLVPVSTAAFITHSAMRSYFHASRSFIDIKSISPQQLSALKAAVSNSEGVIGMKLNKKYAYMNEECLHLDKVIKK